MSDDTMDASSIELTNTEQLTSTPLRIEQDNSVTLSDSEPSLSSQNLKKLKIAELQAFSTPMGFKLVEDNINKQVLHPDYMCSQNSTQSLHYYHCRRNNGHSATQKRHHSPFVMFWRSSLWSIHWPCWRGENHRKQSCKSHLPECWRLGFVSFGYMSPMLQWCK